MVKGDEMTKQTWVGALLLMCGLTTQVQAYVVGDAIEPKMLATLGADSEKVTVVDFFAEWCGSCRKELPLISALNQRINKNQVEIIGVDADVSIEAANRFQAELKRQQALNFKVINDPSQQLVKAFKPLGFPAVYFIKGGKVVKVHYGALNHIDRLIEADLKSLAQE
jgi:cytochrome c biogenesis protein CcmG/thiol:disulfide interchange protein DsbE